MIPLEAVGKLERACGGDLRPALRNPYLKITETVTGRGKNRKTVRSGVLYASDSYVAVSVNVSVEDDETEGMLPLDALKYARSVKPAKNVSIQLVGDRASVFNGAGKEVASFPRGFVDAPDWASIVKPQTEEPVISIGVNPALLSSLSEAMGVNGAGVRLDIYGGLRPMRVTRLGAPETQGVLMPIRLAG